MFSLFLFRFAPEGFETLIFVVVAALFINLSCLPVQASASMLLLFSSSSVEVDPVDMQSVQESPQQKNVPSGSDLPVYAPPNTSTVRRPDLSGTWQLNSKASESNNEDVNDVLAAIKKKGRGDKKTPVPGGQAETTATSLKQWLQAAPRLQILHREPVLTLLPGDAPERIIYTDNRGTSVRASGDLHQYVSICGWEGDKLIQEVTRDDGIRLVRRYTLLEQKQQLQIITEIRTSRRARPVTTRHVYDVVSID